MKNGKKKEKINQVIVCLLLALCLLTLSVLFSLGILISSFNADSGTPKQRAYGSVREQIKNEQLVQ